MNSFVDFEIFSAGKGLGANITGMRLCTSMDQHVADESVAGSEHVI